MKLYVAGPLFTAPERAWTDAPYNAMLIGSADIRLDLPLGSIAEVTRSVLDAVATLGGR
jgi:hypothetical protein